MTDLQIATSALASIGADCQVDLNADGWGLPEYREGELDFPPTVAEITMGCTHQYFDRDTGRFLGWWNHEHSLWHPRVEKE